MAQLGVFLGLLFCLRAAPSPRRLCARLASFLPGPQMWAEAASRVIRFRRAWREAGESEGEKNGFRPVDSLDGLQHSAEITYRVAGEKEKIFFPFKRQHVTRMIPFAVFLARPDGEINITQRPGLPYLASAGQLGGEKIVVRSDESGEEVSYERDEVPGYIEGFE